ncbi:hypothetical protein H4217_009443, partial [Coemansia sp. RSA 1939]
MAKVDRLVRRVAVLKAMEVHLRATEDRLKDMEVLLLKVMAALLLVAVPEDLALPDPLRIKVSRTCVGALTLAVGSNGQIPPNAVQGGAEKDGKPLFVARAIYKGGLHPGKAGEHIQGGGCSIGYGHKEVNLNEYQVLCGNAANLKWVEQENSLVVQGFNPVEGGYEESGEPLFIAKTLYDGSQQLGKCGAHIKHGMSFAYGHKEKTVDKYM